MSALPKTKTVTEKRWAFESHSFGLRTLEIFGRKGESRKDFTARYGIGIRPLGRVVRVTLTFTVSR